MTNFMSNFPLSRRLLVLLVAAFALLPYNVFGADNVALGVKVIVIDAGHGGSRFPGAGYAGIAEKDINLKVALKLGALIEQGLPGVKVVYTRTTDKMFSSVLSEDLQARADIAHRNEGDLFISIHSNAHRNSEVRGVETLIMGESTREQERNQNALYINNKEELLDMSDQKTATIVRAYIQNLQFTYGEYSEMMARLVQEEYVKLGMRNRGVRRQPLKVLYATDMPSILTEIGFMSNKDDLAYITSEKGQDEIAGAIFRAVKTYTNNVRRSLLIDAAPAAEAKPAATEAKPAAKEAPAAKSAPTPKKSAKKSSAEAKPTASAKPEQKQKSAETAKATTTVRYYTIQIAAGNNDLSTSHPCFKSYRGKVWIYRPTNSPVKYKYCYGEFTDKAVAQKQIEAVRKEFPNAFITSFEKTK